MFAMLWIPACAGMTGVERAGAIEDLEKTPMEYAWAQERARRATDWAALLYPATGVPAATTEGCAGRFPGAEEPPRWPDAPRGGW